jgi:hypothetical protein
MPITVQSKCNTQQAPTPSQQSLEPSQNAQTTQGAPTFGDGFKSGFCATAGLPGHLVKEIGRQGHVPQSTPWKQASQAVQIGADMSYAAVTLPAALVVGTGSGVAAKVRSRA